MIKKVEPTNNNSSDLKNNSKIELPKQTNKVANKEIDTILKVK